MDAEEALRISARAWSRDAEVWERYWTPIFRTFALELLRRADLRPGMAVLDVGCGTGLVTLLAARSVGPRGRVVGVDQTPGMLRVARGKALAARLPNVSFQRSHAARLRLPDASFDRVVSNSGIGNAAIPGALEEAHRVLAHGGRIALATWFATSRTSPGARVFAPLNDLFGRYRSRDPDPRLKEAREARALLDRLGRPYASNRAVVQWMRRVGFVDVRHETRVHRITLPGVEYFLEACLGMSYRRAEMRAMGPRRAGLLREALREAYLPYERSGRLVLPWAMTYFTATRA